MNRPEENDASSSATLVLLALFGVLVVVGIVTVVLPEAGDGASAPSTPDAGVAP